MTKQALIVKVCFQTRVVVDVDNQKNVTNWDDLVEKTKAGIQAKLDNNEVDENIETMFPDTECPYGTINGDEQEDLYSSIPKDFPNSYIYGENKRC